MVVSVRGDETQGELEILKSIDATMILHNLPFAEEKTSRVHAARRYVVGVLYQKLLMIVQVSHFEHCATYIVA